MTWSNLPNDIVTSIVASSPARERLAMMAAIPAWQQNDALSWKTTVVAEPGAAQTIKTMEKTLAPNCIETLHVHCRWETSSVASTMIASLCRLVMKHSSSLRDIHIAFEHDEPVRSMDPFRGLCLIASHLFVGCVTLLNARSLSLAGMPVLAEFLPVVTFPPSASISLDGIYVIERKTWIALYVHEELALMTTLQTKTNNRLEALGNHPCHSMTFLNPDGTWMGGMRFVPGDYDFFSYPRFALSILALAM